jgi:hypothetical protein
MMMGSKQRKAVALVIKGATYSEAALAVGISRNAVAGACRRAGVKVGFRPASKAASQKGRRSFWDDPARSAALRQKLSETTKARWRQYRRDMREIERAHA